jgi:hypothetical protein
MKCSKFENGCTFVDKIVAFVCAFVDKFVHLVNNGALNILRYHLWYVSKP